MDGSGRARAICVRVAIVAMVLALAAVSTGNAWAVTYNLFQTQEDFSYNDPSVPYNGPVQDPSNGFILSTTSDFDADGSSTSAQTGTAGTAGSLALAPNGSGNYSTQVFAYLDPNTGYNGVPYNSNPLFFSNLTSGLGSANGGILSWTWARPTSLGAGTYFAEGLTFNYNSHYDLLFFYNNALPGSGETNLGTQTINGVSYTVYKEKLNYKLDMTAINNAIIAQNLYFQMGFVYNSDFYANNVAAMTPVTSPFYLDNITATPLPSPGDFNLDGHVNAADISAAELALKDPSAYQTSMGFSAGDMLVTGDVNGDTTFNNADLQALLTKIISGQGSFSTAVPEPGSLVLLGLAVPALVTVAQRRRK